MTARGPRKATSRMSGKVESDGAQSMFSLGNSRVQQFTGDVFFPGRSIHAAPRPRIGFSRFNLPHRVCPGCPTLLRQLGSHCRGVDGDGEMGREQTRPGGSPGWSLPRAIGSVLQRNERQSPFRFWSAFGSQKRDPRPAEKLDHVEIYRRPRVTFKEPTACLVHDCRPGQRLDQTLRGVRPGGEKPRRCCGQHPVEYSGPR